MLHVLSITECAHTTRTIITDGLPWATAKRYLRDAIGEEAYLHWFGRMFLEDISNGTAHLSVPTLFLKRWVSAHYVAQLIQCLGNEYPEVHSIAVTVRTAVRAAVAPDTVPEDAPVVPQRLWSGRCIQDIQHCVAAQYNISRADMLSSRKLKRIARPRQIAMYLAKVLAQRTFPEIGMCFKRDHTTILHAFRKIEKCIKEDTNIAAEVNALKQQLPV